MELTLLADAFKAPQLYRYLVLDIETDNGSPDEVEAALRARWLPPANHKTPQAVGSAWLSFLERRADKLALADQAPVAIVSLVGVTDTGRELRALHCLEAAEIRYFEGAAVEGFASERAMLAALRGLLDQFTTPDTEIVGHNIQGFDLPKLRYRYLKHGLRLPMALGAGAAPVFDTMRRFCRDFSKDDQPFVSLDWLLKELGIPSHKGEMDGSKVPVYIADGRFDDLLRYALRDVLVEEEVYLRMTGGHEDRPEAQP